VDKNLVVFGEVGLAGEIRAVSQPEVRIKEAKKLGFSRCLLPKGNVETCSRIEGVEIVPVETVRNLMEVLL
jgi:DNA repair protein RadA/Sms